MYIQKEAYAVSANRRRLRFFESLSGCLSTAGCLLGVYVHSRRRREPYTPEVEYHHQKGGRINIELKRHYRDMTRIVKGLPSGDWLAVGWREVWT